MRLFFILATVSFNFFFPPVPETGNSKIVFSSNREGSYQIYVMNGDGSGVVRLTNSGANDEVPRWSPNGAKILFQSDRDHADTGYMDIYLMNANGTGVIRLTSDANDNSMAAWSPNGTRIAFQSRRNGMNYQVYSMNADGSNQTNLSNNSSSDGEPSWSPDGTKLVFASDRDHPGTDNIYVMNSDGSNQHSLTSTNGIIEDTQPVWAPDGSKLAFVSTRDSTSETWQETDDDGNYITKSALPINKEIYVMNADGSGQTRLTNNPANDESPLWSPLGLTILFRSDRERECCDPTAQIWSMNADGTNQIDLSNDGNSNDYNAAVTIDITNAGSQLASNYSGNQPPVANAGGSYTAQTGQAVQLNGAASFDPDGTIVNYTWNFGDGTSGTGEVTNHQYGAGGVYPVSLTVSDNSGNTSSAQGFVTVDSAALPVKITFDELLDNTVVADQYLNQYGVRFSSANFFFPVHTKRECGPTCSPVSFPNFISTKPDDAGQLIATFQQSVSNLVFYAVGVDTLSGTFAFVDLYRNGSVTPSNTFAMNGNFTTTVGFSSGTLNNIDKLVVRGITDPAGIGFDDFSFTVPADVKITSGRVPGHLNGTSQKALLGADVALNASALPGAFSGGTYSWTFTGSPTPLTAMNQVSASVRWLQTGTYQATVTYTKSGQSATSVLNVEVIIPTVSAFFATQSADRLGRDLRCSDFPLGVTYTLGCANSFGSTPIGILWTANAQIPEATYLSNPAQSGIKFVQAVSGYRKRRNNGNTECFTARTSEFNVDSGWQLDTTDPYNNSAYFSDGNTLFLFDDDNPGTLIEGLLPSTGYFSRDAQYVSDRFETYLYYFTTNASNRDASNPIFQRPLGLPGSSQPVAHLNWSWGGLVAYDYYSFPPSLEYTLTSNTGPGGILATSASSTRSIATNVKDNEWHPCGSSAPTSNPIDDSATYIGQLYLDFLGRPPDIDGWNFWRTNITQCVFDEECIANKRVDVARAFFYSTEFVGRHPELAGQRGIHDYNLQFVYACYRGFLRREPNEYPDHDWTGFNFWVTKLDSTNPDAGDWKYNEMLKAFLDSTEYRGRFEPLIP